MALARMLRRSLAAALALLTLVAVARAAGEPPTPSAVEGGYRLSAGDRIAVTVYGHPDLSGEHRIDGSGTIAFPLVGPIRLAGLDLRRAEAAIVARLRPDYLRRPQVGIQVLSFRPVFVLGEVKKPGGYRYRQGLTVIEAVALAGGYTYRADPEDTTILRRSASEAAPRAAGEQTPVQPGDTIRVPERFF